MNTSNYKKVIEKAVKAAGDYAFEKYMTFDRSAVTVKKANEGLLTNVDLESENIIMTEIRKNFPDHHILSEEAGDNKNDSEYFWIIDPIDGTTNFTMHNPLWAVSVALAYKDKIILGIIYAPCLKEMFVAEAGKGAALNGKKIKVSNLKTGRMLNTFCSGRERKHVEKVVKFFTKQRLSENTAYILGTAALDLAYVACGRIETAFIPGVNIWDIAAGVLLVQEAGGKITDSKGRPWTLKSEDMAASNGLVHKELMKVVRDI